MKILLTTDPEIPVPPKLYGGGERVAYGLIKGFVNKGHKVILVANPESTAAEATKIIGWEGKSSISKKDILKNALQLYRIYKKHQPDVVLSFSRLLYTYPLLILEKNVKVVQRYGRLISAKSTTIGRKVGRNKLYFSCVAEHMLQHISNKNSWKVLNNFANTDYFEPIDTPSLDYYAFLGRIEPIKGPEEAIKAAIETNNKLIIAGNVPEDFREYFSKTIEPYLEHPLIEYIGPVDDTKKREFLQNAIAMLFPINLKSEAFSNVVAESLACGTPVIGYNIAFVPEAIKNGLNGFVVKNLNEMKEAMRKISTISRKKVREDSLNRFSMEKITNGYISYFKSILEVGK